MIADCQHIILHSILSNRCINMSTTIHHTIRQFLPVLLINTSKKYKSSYPLRTNKMSLKQKYEFFTKDKPLTRDTLFDLLSSCNRIPPMHDSNIEVPRTYEEFERLANSCKEMSDKKDLLRHLIAFNRGNSVIEKENFEKYFIGDKFSKEEKEELYRFINVQDNMINLEEFVEQITEDAKN